MDYGLRSPKRRRGRVEGPLSENHWLHPIVYGNQCPVTNVPRPRPCSRHPTRSKEDASDAQQPDCLPERTPRVNRRRRVVPSLFGPKRIGANRHGIGNQTNSHLLMNQERRDKQARQANRAIRRGRCMITLFTSEETVPRPPIGEPPPRRSIDGDRADAEEGREGASRMAHDLDA